MLTLENKKKIIFYSYLILLYFFFLNIDKSFSPDYIAYFKRGHYSNWYLKNEYHYGFIFNLLLNLLWSSKLSYHGIVNIIYSISFILFVFSIYNFSKYYAFFQNKKFNIIFFLFLIYSILIVFEFFIIRIRSGLSISLILLSFSFLLNKKKFLYLVLLIISFSVHIETTICLTYVSSLLFFLNYIGIKNKNIKEIFIFVTIPALIFLLSFFLNIFSLRNNVGILVEKPLNIYRSLLYIFPLILFILYNNQKKFAFIENCSFLLKYIKCISFFMFTIFVSLFTPISQYAGEDIHRVFSVFTLPLIFLIMSKEIDNFLLIIFSYIILINFVLFFKNFTYLI